MQENKENLHFMEENRNTIFCGDALETLRSFPDESIDCVITSPPYYGLRD